MNKNETKKSENVPFAIALSLAALVIFGIQDIAVKKLVGDFAPAQIVMIRFWGVGLFMLFWIWRSNDLAHVVHSHFPKLQVMRSILLLVDIWLFTAALDYMQTSDLQAIFMVYPIAVSLLAVPILGEKLGIYGWMAVLLGFAGALIVVRPGFQHVDHSVLLVIGAVISFSLYTVLTRKVATKDSTKTSMFYMAVVTLLLSTATGLFHVKAMNVEASIIMLVVTICAITTHLLFTEALRFAPASTLQPLNFLALPIAVALTFLVFGHVTDLITIAGGALTILAGLMVWFGSRPVR